MRHEDLVVLFNQMTVEEKIAQLMQLPGHFYSNDGEITGPIAELGISKEIVEQTGSTLGISGAAETIRVQEEYLKTSRLKIPLLLMADVVHGYRTIFPIPLGMGASWNLDLAKKSAEVAAKESDVAGVHVTFAPMVDLVRDPRWGRVMESTGEDPHLNSAFSKAMVEGFQGKDMGSGHVAACVKHFAAYGAAEAGRDYNTVDMSRRALREFYLPAYKAAIDADVKMIMTSFNTVEGVPATINEWLLKDLLRDEWKFGGTVISDYTSLAEVVNHGQASDLYGAAELGLNAGLDIEMSSPSYVKHLPQLLAEGKVSMEQIDASVMRILQLKNELGLFENPHRGANVEREKEIIFSLEHQKVALELAEESLVLLKNEKALLPLNAEQKIALIGPKIKSRDMIGAWCWKGNKDETPNMDEAMREYFNHVESAEGTSITEIKDMEDALEVVKQSDVVVMALGESRSSSGEARSCANITLSEAQLELVAKVKELNKPIVALIFNGRPLDLRGVVEHVDALMICWFGGTQSAPAIARTLVGKSNPSGKLSMTFPYSVGQVPVYYNAFNTGRPAKGFIPVVGYAEEYLSKYLDIPNEPLFAFGCGMGYSPFSYSDIALSADTLTADTAITASITVTNNGKYAGKEVLQLYIRDLVSSVVRPVKELKDFKKIHLDAGASERITFTITEPMLRFYNNKEEYQSEKGDFKLFIGTSSLETKEIIFSLK